jgi:NhaP-type Na+/H+ or K+/H+ antiporter
VTLLGIFVLLLFLFSLVSRPVDRSPLTPPIVFTAAGLGAALVATRLPPGAADDGAFLTIAELGLVLLLFADASHIDLKRLRSIRALPVRLLSVGMLLTIGLGLAAARVLFADLTLWEAGILAAILAPTDAGLGQAIVTDERVPRQVREGLNVEAGLNDGLAVPFLLFFMALAGSAGGQHEASLTRFVVEQLGYGAAVGLVVGRGGGWIDARARRLGWISGSFGKLGFLALPLLCMLISQGVGASMFIAAFVAGLATPRTGGLAGHGIEFIEDWGQLINLAVFFLFGVLFASAWPDLRPVHLVYGLLSLTIVRMLPVALALAGSGLSAASVGFIGWFGPRGLASIVLGLVYLEHALGAMHPTVHLAVMATVLLSILAHGLTARPAAARYGRHVASLPDTAPERAGERI